MTACCASRSSCPAHQWVLERKLKARETGVTRGECLTDERMKMSFKGNPTCRRFSASLTQESRGFAAWELGCTKSVHPHGLTRWELPRWAPIHILVCIKKRKSWLAGNSTTLYYIRLLDIIFFLVTCHFKVSFQSFPLLIS